MEDQRPQGNGLAVAGFVLGLLALVLCWIPFVNWILGILGIIFGAIGMNKSKIVGKGKGLAIAGLVCGIVGSVAGVFVWMAATKNFTAYMDKARGFEAKAGVRRIARSAQTVQIERAEFPRGDVGPTPASPCCSQPGHKCQANPADWNDPVWKALDYSQEMPSRYQYSYSSSDGKSFVVRAIGDLDCGGKATTFEAHGTVTSSGNVEITYSGD